MSRYENKYLVSAATRVALLPLLKARMRFDPHGSIAPGTYPIFSIYMDTDDLACYHEKIDGLFKRCKVRLRHYSPDRPPYFLEMKGRVNAQIVKKRAILSDEEFDCCVHGRPVPDDRGNDAIIEYNQYVAARRIKPVAVIGYIREAFESHLPGDLRVTFDYNVTCRQYSYKGDINHATYRTMHEQWYILEIKFNMFMPQWISDIVKRFSLWNETSCKYGYGINRLLKLGRLAEPAPLDYKPLVPLFSRPPKEDKGRLIEVPSREPLIAPPVPVPVPSRAVALSAGGQK